MALILVRGAGDVGSAVAHALSRAGHRVVIHDLPKPAHTRRGMSFTDVLYSGKSELEGVFAKRARSLAELRHMVDCGRAIAVVDAELHAVIEATKPDVVVDASMRKHEVPDRQRGLAPLTVGLGPNFVAGEVVDVAIESAWGPQLGAVIESGATAPQAGEPKDLGGRGRERFAYAPISGHFRTDLDIGAHVGAGQPVARIGDTALVAPLAGCLRGLTHDGAWVRAGAKVIEVDPRDDPALVLGLGERPSRIAEGVLRALASAA